MRYATEVRERAVRMVSDHAADHGSQWAAIQSIAPKIGCTAETLRRWVREAEKAAVPGAEARAEEAARMKALEREVRELRQANEILRKASAYFAPALAHAKHVLPAAGRSSTARRSDDRVHR